MKMKNEKDPYHNAAYHTTKLILLLSYGICICMGSESSCAASQHAPRPSTVTLRSFRFVFSPARGTGGGGDDDARLPPKGTGALTPLCRRPFRNRGLFFLLL
jgi:hypothetical protein